MSLMTIIYVGTQNGLYALSYADRQWRAISLGLVGQNIIDLAVVGGSPATLYGVAKESGLYHTDNGGHSWRRIVSAKAHCLLVDETNARRLWLGLEPAGLLRSLDQAKSWQDLTDKVQMVPGSADWSLAEPPYQAQMKVLAQMPGQANCLLAGIVEGDLLRSSDGGDTWALSEAEESDIHALAVQPAKPDFWLAAGQDGLYFSEDAGHTWAEVDDVFGYCSALVIMSSGLCLVAVAPCPPGHWVENVATTLYQLTIEAGQWQITEYSFSDYIITLAVDQGTIYAGAQSGRVYLSEDGGQSWQQIADLAAGVNQLWIAGRS